MIHKPTMIAIGDAARLLKVSRSTIHRMCDKGMLPYVETRGGHRRIKMSDAMAVAQQLRGQLHSNDSQCSDLDARMIADHLLRGKELAVLRWLLASGGEAMVQKLETEIYWAIIEIDSRFTSGVVSMPQMHFAMATLRSILDRSLQSIEIPDNAPIAVGGTPTDDGQGLGLRFAQIGLRLSGLKPVNLGGKLSPALLGEAVMELDASSVWLSYSHVSNPVNVVQWHHRLASILPRHVRVFIGGGALSPLIRRQLPKHTFYESISSLVAGENQQPAQRLRRMGCLAMVNSIAPLLSFL